MIPDTSVTGDMKFSLYVRKYPQTTETTKGPYTITSSDGKLSLRAKGRQARVRFESDTTGAERVQTLFTGCELIEAPTNTTPDLPRPLYVPTANRGDLLVLEIELTGVALIGVHLYDIFESNVTP